MNSIPIFGPEGLNRAGRNTENLVTTLKKAVLIFFVAKGRNRVVIMFTDVPRSIPAVRSSDSIRFIHDHPKKLRARSLNEATNFSSVFLPQS
jgi:hypothetical protein